MPGKSSGTTVSSFATNRASVGMRTICSSENAPSPLTFSTAAREGPFVSALGSK